jgi:hypothetical protein
MGTSPEAAEVIVGMCFNSYHKTITPTCQWQ